MREFTVLPILVFILFIINVCVREGGRKRETKSEDLVGSAQQVHS